MHSYETIRAALELSDAGANQTEIGRQLGIPRRTVSDWLRGVLPHAADAPAKCLDHDADLGREYIYLLGLYLGDGCISSHRRGVYRLRIVLDVKYRNVARLDEFIGPKRRTRRFSVTSQILNPADRC